jgi:hypothetical protein
MLSNARSFSDKINDVVEELPRVRKVFNVKNSSSGYSSNESIIAKRESIKRIISGNFDGPLNPAISAASGVFKQRDYSQEISQFFN